MTLSFFGAHLLLSSIHAHYYRSVLGGMCVHFKFPGLARVLNLYCLFVYSVIDPSGTNIFQVDCLSRVLLAPWRGRCWGRHPFGSLPIQCIFLNFLYSTLCGPFTDDDFAGFDIWNLF